MEVVVEWNFDNGSTYNVSMEWMTLPSHRTYQWQITSAGHNIIIIILQ